MKLATKNALWRIYAYTVVGAFVLLIGSMVLVSKSIYRGSDIMWAEFQMADTEHFLYKVDYSLYLCQNLGRIPYPLNAYIAQEGRENMKPFTAPERE